MTLYIILFIASFLLGALGYIEKISGRKWSRITHVLLFILYTIVIIGTYRYTTNKDKSSQEKLAESNTKLASMKKELTESNIKIESMKNTLTESNTKVESMIEKELIVRDIKIKTIYDFRFSKEIDTSSRSSGVVGLTTTAALGETPSNEGFSKEKALILYTGINRLYTYPNSKTLRVSLLFEPRDNITNPIEWLEKYKVLAIPYKSLIESLNKFNKFTFLQNTTVNVVILINGKIYDDIKQDTDLSFDKQLLFITKRNGLFNNVKSKYLDILGIRVNKSSPGKSAATSP